MKSDLEKIMAGPEYFDCGRLKARISARQCLLNQGKAKGLKLIGTRFMGREALCLDCETGQGMMAWPPGVLPGPALQPFSPPVDTPSPQPSPTRGEGGKDHRLENDKDHRQDACATRKPKKLPAWLQNASPAVRRDYLKEKG